MESTEQQLATTKATSIADQALTVIDPVAYVAAVYKPFNARLAEAVAGEKDVSYDIATTAGMKIAIARRALFRDIRTEGEKERKARKAPILQIGKLLDSSYAELETAVLPHEDKHNEAIKAEETRKEAEKEAKAEAERQRVAALNKRIAEISALPTRAVGKSAADIAALIEEATAIEVGDDFAELLGVAAIAREDAIEALTTLHTAKAAEEQEAARAVEAARIAAEEQAEITRRLQEERNALEVQRAEQDRINREQAEANAKLARELQERADALAESERLAAEAEQKRIADAEALQREVDHAARMKNAGVTAGGDYAPPVTLEEIVREVVPSDIADGMFGEGDSLPSVVPSLIDDQVREIEQTKPTGPTDDEIVNLVITTYGLAREEVLWRFANISARAAA